LVTLCSKTSISIKVFSNSFRFSKLSFSSIFLPIISPILVIFYELLFNSKAISVEVIIYIFSSFLVNISFFLGIKKSIKRG
jgi:hypothetical protein